MEISVASHKVRNIQGWGEPVQSRLYSSREYSVKFSASYLVLSDVFYISFHIDLYLYLDVYFRHCHQSCYFVTTCMHKHLL